MVVVLVVEVLVTVVKDVALGFVVIVDKVEEVLWDVEVTALDDCEVEVIVLVTVVGTVVVDVF